MPENTLAMRFFNRHFSAFPVLLLLLACTVESGEDATDDEESESGSGGSGDLGSGGAESSGGSFGSGGLAAVGGSSSGGEFSGVGGFWTDTGGSGSGGSEPVSDAVPSPGCGKAGRPASGRVVKSGVSWLIFPEKYDGNTPLPVLFGFHGCGTGNAGDNTRTQFLDLTRSSGFETDYVVAAPIATSGSCYDYGTDMPKAKALYDDLVDNYCVDMSRVFGSGHSYGAGGMLMTLTASNNKADFDHFNFRGIAPVAGWLIGSQSTLVPTMYIQGIADAERGNGDGADVVQKIVSVNQCDAGSTPYPVNSCNSSHDSDPVTAGCKSYSGCDVPTIWCRHDDSAYGGTFHGIPCFYKQAVYDFFASL